MKEKKELDPNRKAAYRRSRIFAAVLTYSAGILALACMIGIVVAVLMLNFGTSSERRDLILYILAGAFAGGTVLFALCTVLFSKYMNAAAARELDFRERLDGEESFFVGEGTLLTFGEKGVTLHSEDGKRETVFVPYEETRYISICTRRSPKEKGNWCVAIEMPVKYLSKKRDAAGDGEKVLVQADAKDRLYEALKKHGLELLGEERNDGKQTKKFTRVKKFSLPNRRKSSNALIMIVVGAVVAVASVFVGIYWSPSVGALAGAVGCVLLFRGILNYVRAKAVFGVYEEGIFWRESNGAERLFLKWDDIEEVSIGEQKGYPVLIFRCSYGRYAIPAVEGAYKSIKELKKEKCTTEN